MIFAFSVLLSSTLFTYFILSFRLYRVQHEVVSGLKYLQVVKRKGVRGKLTIIIFKQKNKNKNKGINYHVKRKKKMKIKHTNCGSCHRYF